jgi:hypothetical protein
VGDRATVVLQVEYRFDEIRFVFLGGGMRELSGLALG